MMLRCGCHVLPQVQARSQIITPSTTTRASVAALAVLILVPGSVGAGSQPTAAEIFKLRAYCAEARDAFKEAYESEMKKADDEWIVHGQSAFASNYNTRTNRCYLMVKHSWLLLDEPKKYESAKRKESVHLYDLHLSETPIAVCSEIQNFIPEGEVLQQDACAYIYRMIYTDLDERQ
jgi:hypothetical protein